MKIFNAIGLSCSAIPVEIKNYLETEKPTSLQVIVNSEACQISVQRLLQNNGFETTLDKVGNDYYLLGRRDPQTSPTPESPSSEAGTEKKKTMVFCSTDQLGDGDNALGEKLIINFIRTLKEWGDDLWLLVFVNAGVKLTIDESALLDDLKAYELAGVQILVCGTCLEHYDLLRRKRVGETTNMLDIVSAMNIADNVITL